MSIPQFSKDVRDLIELLARHSVRYVLIGGSAVIYHGYPRYTGDVDFFYDVDSENCKKLFAALTDFWNGPIPEVESYKVLTRIGQVLQFGVPPFRIDLINRIDGVTFEEVLASAIQESILHNEKSLPIQIISKESLRKNKTASARAKDLDDLKNI